MLQLTLFPSVIVLRRYVAAAAAAIQTIELDLEYCLRTDLNSLEITVKLRGRILFKTYFYSTAHMQGGEFFGLGTFVSAFTFFRSTCSIQLSKLLVIRLLCEECFRHNVSKTKRITASL